MGQRRGERGTQTLEVVIALSLLAISLVGLTGLLVGTISAGAVAETSSVASNLARQRIDELLSQPAIPPGPWTDTRTVQVPPVARPFQIDTAATAPVSKLMDITVTVTWQVAFGSACAGPSCVGNVRTYTRTVKTKVCVVGGALC